MCRHFLTKTNLRFVCELLARWRFWSIRGSGSGALGHGGGHADALRFGHVAEACVQGILGVVPHMVTGSTSVVDGKDYHNSALL